MLMSNISTCQVLSDAQVWNIPAVETALIAALVLLRRRCVLHLQFVRDLHAFFKRGGPSCSVPAAAGEGILVEEGNILPRLGEGIP